MNASFRIGVLGVGVFLPDEVRTNDWWPPEVVEQWRRRRSDRIARGDRYEEVEVTEGVRRVFAAMAELRDDPFVGSRERRIMPEGMLATDMEVAAARQAIDRAGVAPGDIDFLLTSPMVADNIGTNNAPRVHLELGLRTDCLALEVAGLCNSLLLQLTVAEQMLLSGRARAGLLVQSSQLSRVAEQADPLSCWFGDGAGAVVVGGVRNERGILGRSTRSLGKYQRVIVYEPDSAPWYAAGRAVVRATEPVLGREILLQSADIAREMVSEALAEAGHAPEEVNFYAAHQPNPWFGRVTQEHCGMVNARRLDTFARAGHLGGANLALVLHTAEEEGLVVDGDLVVAHSGGGGMTLSALVLRWGR